MASITFDGLSKVYPDGTTAVHAMDLVVEDGEFVVLVGPSGCGKTTALRCVAGLEEISGGEIRIGDNVVNNVAPKDRDIAMVFQNYALYPHLTVRDNIGFGLKLRKVDRKEIAERVNEAAGLLGIEEFLDRRPKALSGGQRQRVAMGRAIVRQPSAFLMDEPLSNLDAKLRVQMRAEVMRIQHDLKTTTIYVTHDQVEAMTMGDRVAVMKKGRLQQVAVPQTLYDHPVNLFVAGFIGSPGMNMVEAQFTIEAGTAEVAFGEQRLTVDPKLLKDRPGLEQHAGKTIVLGIRPEELRDAELAPDHPADRRMRLGVELIEALGAEVLVHVGVGAPPVLTDDTIELAADATREDADTITQRERKRGSSWVARFHPRTQARVGDVAEIAVDTSRLHFFSADGAAIN